MDKVVITKSKVDSLADKIRAKSGTSGNMTIDQMGDTVEALPQSMPIINSGVAGIAKINLSLSVELGGN